MSFANFTKEYSPRFTELVKSPGDLAGDLRSDTCYMIDGVIDMGAQSVVVPQGGLTILGCGFGGVSKLITSDPSVVLFKDDGTFSGDLFLTAMEVEVTGVGSQVFGITNSGNDAIEFNQVNFIGCVSMGVLSDYRQLLARNVAFIVPADGLEFVGVWSGGIAIIDTIAIAVPAGVTLFKAGTGFIIGSSLRTDMNAISIDDTATVFDFSPSNFTPDGSFALNGFRTNPNASAVPNTSSSDVKAFFKNCRGIKNTFVGGEFRISSATATVIPAVDTLVKMAGTTTYNDLAWFTGSVSNEFLAVSDIELDMNISGILSFTGGSNAEIAVQIRQWDDSAAGYIDIGSEFKATMSVGGRGEGIAFQGIATVNKDDRIEIWVKTLTGSSNITGQVGGSVIISERAP